MASNQNHQKDVRIFIFFCMALSQMLRNELVDGRETSIKTKNKVIKGQNGEIIECVDIYKQPAFSHPLLKNHTLQMKPSSYPAGLEAGDFLVGLSQKWHKNGKCPSGTIPILRSQSNGHKKSSPFVQNRNPTHEYAQVSLEGDKYHGAQSRIGVWNPLVFNGEISVSQMWLTAGDGEGLNTIEAGWIVPSGESVTKLFIYWTRDEYKSTGCYNLQCPGFVQTDPTVALGGALAVSHYGGANYDIIISIFKDKQTGNWWLHVVDQVVGYWPGSIFTSLADSTTSISWGGEIVNHATGGKHTPTQMGNGHFPVEGPGKVGYFRNLGYIGVDDGNFKDPPKLDPYVTRPECYDLQIQQSEATDGVHFFYGGPGYSDKCQ